jgi:hypothetical protein
MADQDKRLANVVRIIGWSLLIAAGIGAAVFLFLPFFRGARGKISVGETFRKLWLSIVTNINNTLSTIRDAIQKIKDRRRMRAWKRVGSKGRTSAIQETLERAAARLGLTRKEKRTHGKLLRTFFRFTRWGEKHGVPFRTTMGAWEYALKFNTESAELRKECIDIAAMFEEAMYSHHDIQEHFKNTFADKVKNIIKTK